MKTKLLGTTFRQLIAVLEYVVLGNSPDDFEREPKTSKDDEDEDSPSLLPPDDDIDFSVGVVSEGMILEIGSMSDLKSMTMSHLQTLIAYKNAMKYGPNKARDARHIGEYYRVLEEIREAHRGK